MSDKPVTLADVREHIERRIRDVSSMSNGLPDDLDTCCKHNITRELTEVLAMLQQIEQRDQAALEELDKLVDKERERRR